MGLTALVLAGCGASHTRRDAVNRYFDQVDSAQQPVRANEQMIMRALTRYSVTRSNERELGDLVRTRAIFARVGRRLAGVRVPVEARTIQRQLLSLYDVQADIAGELVQMTKFAPRYRAALEPLEPTHARFAARLKRSKDWEPLRKTFARYRLGLQGVLARLDALEPPRTFRPSFELERNGLRRSVSLCVAVERALEQHDRKATDVAVQALAALDTETALARAQQGQIAATRAYNTRLARVSALVTKIQDERNRLVDDVG